MRKKRLRLILPLLVLTVLSGCTNDESLRTDEQSVRAQLAFAVSPLTKLHQDKAPQHRSAASVVQADDHFRGLQELHLIPFSKRGRVEVDDQPRLFGVDYSAGSDYSKTNAHFFYYEGMQLMDGVASFLVYARAAGSSDASLANKQYYGALTANYPVDGNPADISFNLQSIRDNNDVPSEAADIARYLTAIAHAECLHEAHTYSWSAATDSKLQAFFLNFINQGQETTAPMAGSSVNVNAYVRELRSKIAALNYSDWTVERKLQQAIIDSIDNKAVGLPVNYPASIGLPDGAAVVRYTNGQFVPQTTTTTLARVAGIRRYAHPADLYYYANSQIKTTTTDTRKTYYENEATWTDVLARYETDNGVVRNNTTSVAIKEPVHYAVGCLQMRLNPLTVSLSDADGRYITVDATTFPLTGIIVGSQRPVGFDFKPTSTSEVDVRYVYDCYPVAPDNSVIYLPPYGGTTSANSNTLLLQTPDDEEVTVIAEFQNNSNVTFRGLNGLVYPGTRFYLLGILAPEGGATHDYQRRVITQDYVTTLNVSVNSLRKAYNVVPDLLTERLEVGIQLTADWKMATPTIVELE